MTSANQNLTTLYEDVVQKIYDTNDISRYHLKSIGNFISYLDEIKNKILRDDVETGIRYYLENINGLIDLEKMHSLEIFEKYVKPIGTLYVNELNFSIKVKPFIIITWFIITIAVFYPIFKSIYLCFVILIFFYFIRIHFLFKEKQRKVWGYNY